jgi:site-specific DNA recombinase
MKKPGRPEARKPVGIWLRVSTENQAKGDSPEHHEKRARYYAESRDWDVVEVYHLEAVSGKSVIEHPEARRMLKDVRSGRITGLIFSKLARLARNTKELLEFSDIFREVDADLISLQESIDTSTPAGRLFYTMIAAMAQWEREEIADRVSASIAVRAKLGKPLNGKVPFGYCWKDKKIVPHPAEAPVRRLIYELFLEHGRKKTVARLLNEAGHRTRDGSQWSDTSVGRLIADPTAKGLHRANYTRRAAGNRPYEIKSEDEWVWTEVEAVVPEEVWEKCNELLRERKQKQNRPGKRPVHLFAGITHCHCGRKMYVPSNSPKYVCQSCRNKIPVMDLEAVFYEQLKGFFLSPQEIAAHLAKADEKIAEKEEVLRVLEKEHAKVEDEIQRIYRLYSEGGLTAEGFGKFYRPLEERQRQLDDELPRLQAEVDVRKINNLSGDRVLSEAKDLYGRWPDLTRDEKRRIVESISEKIVVGKDDIDITLCYLPSSEELTKEQRCL